MDGPGIEPSGKNGSNVTGQRKWAGKVDGLALRKWSLAKISISLLHKSRDSEIISNHPSGYYKIII